MMPERKGKRCTALRVDSVLIRGQQVATNGVRAAVKRRRSCHPPFALLLLLLSSLPLLWTFVEAPFRHPESEIMTPKTSLIEESSVTGIGASRASLNGAFIENGKRSLPVSTHFPRSSGHGNRLLRPIGSMTPRFDFGQKESRVRNRGRYSFFGGTPVANPFSVEHVDQREPLRSVVAKLVSHPPSFGKAGLEPKRVLHVGRGEIGRARPLPLMRGPPHAALQVKKVKGTKEDEEEQLGSDEGSEEDEEPDDVPGDEDNEADESEEENEEKGTEKGKSEKKSKKKEKEPGPAASEIDDLESGVGASEAQFAEEKKEKQNAESEAKKEPENIQDSVAGMASSGEDAESGEEQKAAKGKGGDRVKEASGEDSGRTQIEAEDEEKNENQHSGSEQRQHSAMEEGNSNVKDGEKNKGETGGRLSDGEGKESIDDKGKDAEKGSTLSHTGGSAVEREMATHGVEPENVTAKTGTETFVGAFSMPAPSAPLPRGHLDWTVDYGWFPPWRARGS